MTQTHKIACMFAEVMNEVERAQAKFPSPDYLTTALAEESGEAIRAVMEYMFAVKRNKSESDLLALRREVRKELVQTMAMCIRLELEGDPIHLLPAAKE